MSKKAVDELRARGKTVNDQFETLQWKGMDVYRTPGSNMITLKEVLTKLTSSIPKKTDRVQDNLDTATALIEAGVLTDKKLCPNGPA